MVFTFRFRLGFLTQAFDWMEVISHDDTKKFISISKNPKAQEASFHLYFKCVPAPRSAKGFASLITHNVWSPIVWSQQKRKQSNFERCDYLALDIDDGWTIKEAIEWATERKYSVIIATSKSHQIPKDDKPPCDRFRMVLPFEKTITDLDTYRYNMKEVMKLVPCDKATKDGARYFFPCRDIVYQQIGSRYPVLTIPEDYVTQREIVLRKKARNKNYINAGVTPVWVNEVFLNGPPDGWSRNTTIFKVSATLSELGWDYETILHEVRHTPYLKTLSIDEIERTILNGQRNAQS